MGMKEGWGSWLLPSALVFVALSGYAQAITTVRIQDTLFNADGSKVKGRLTIEWKGFTASDGTTLATSSVKVKIVQGVLIVDLVPNDNSTPPGTSYTVTYLLDSGKRFVETWSVPESSTPVTVSDVRIGQPPPAGGVITMSQVSGLVAALDSKADLDQTNVFTAEQIIQESSPGSTLLTLRDSGGTNSIGFNLPTLTTSTLYTWPVSDGLPGQQLTTDGGANLFWSAAGSGAIGTSYEIFQDSGTAVTQRTVANFSSGLTAFDNVGSTRTEVQPVYGTAAGTITEGSDPRLSDARTPLAHASSHANGGSDAVTPGSIGALTNTNDVMNGASPGTPVLIVRGITGQAASVQEWRDGNNDLLGLITPDGSAFFREMGLATKLGGTVVSQFFQIDGKNKFAFSAFDTALNISRYDDAGNFKDTGFQILRDGGTFVNTPFTVRSLTPVTGTTTLTVKAGEGQGTTKLQEWQNNGGTVLSSVDESGNLEMNGHYIDFDQMTAPLPPATNRVRLFVDAASGELSVKKDTGSVISLEQGTGGPGSTFALFHDAETPTGTINGVNATFTLVTAPNPAASLELTRNGIVQKSGVDYTLSTNVITFLAGAIPQTGDILLAWYRSDGSNAGGDDGDVIPTFSCGGDSGQTVVSSRGAFRRFDGDLSQPSCGGDSGRRGVARGAFRR